MFIELETLKKEKLVINANRIEYFTETKKGTLIVFTDGLEVEVSYSYDEMKHILKDEKVLIDIIPF